MTTDQTATGAADSGSNGRSGPQYELRNVSKQFGSGDTAVHALRNIDLTVNVGEMLAIVGTSGSGKTTLLQLLGALDRPTSGHVFCAGRDLAEMSEGELTSLRRHVVGFVFQQFNLIPTLTAAQNVEVAALGTAVAGTDRQTRALDLLAAMGLGNRGTHLPSQLSGGEQQRVAVARALVNEPSVLLADEPTGNLDSGTGAEILTLLQTLAHENGQTLIVITHAPDVTERMLRVVSLRDGQIAEDTGR